MANQGVPVLVSIDRAAAILAGHSQFGQAEVYVDPARLSQDERAELAAAATFPGFTTGFERLDLTERSAPFTTDVRHLDGKSFASLAQVRYPTLVKADEAAVREVLAARRERRVAVEACKAALEVEERQDWEAAQREWLAKPGAELLRETVYGSDRQIASRRVSKPYSMKKGGGYYEERYGYLPEVKERLAALLAEAEAQIAQEQENARVVRERAKAEEQAKAERLRERREVYVEVLCSDEQKRRHAAGLLPESEILDLARKAVFEPLNAFPRFKKITRSEVIAAAEADGDYVEEDAEVEFQSGPAETATAEEFAALEAIQRVAKGSIPYDVTCRLVDHFGGLKRNKEWGVARAAVEVEVSDGAYRFTRKYAAE